MFSYFIFFMTGAATALFASKILKHGAVLYTASKTAEYMFLGHMMALERMLKIYEKHIEDDKLKSEINGMIEELGNHTLTYLRGFLPYKVSYRNWDEAKRYYERIERL